MNLLFNSGVMAGTFTRSDGATAQVFLRVRKKSQEKERVILQLLHEQKGVAAPRFLGMIDVHERTILLQSFIAGQDLAELLPPGQGRPPLPVPPASYRDCSEQELVPALTELGATLAALHRVKLSQFGAVSGEEPNPYRQNAQAFTLQEALHALERCRAHGWVPHRHVSRLEPWLQEQVRLIAPAEQPTLVHADLHPGNIRLAQDRAQVWRFQGLIDFEHAHAWLAEYDLVLLKWHLSSSILWEAFLAGYAPIEQERPIEATRLPLFEVVKLLMIMSVRMPAQSEPYGEWARQRLMELSV